MRRVDGLTPKIVASASSPLFISHLPRSKLVHGHYFISISSETRPYLQQLIINSEISPKLEVEKFSRHTRKLSFYQIYLPEDHLFSTLGRSETGLRHRKLYSTDAFLQLPYVESMTVARKLMRTFVVSWMVTFGIVHGIHPHSRAELVHLDSQCDFIRRRDASWVFGAVKQCGICNQLFGLFNYVPVALLLRSDLVIGPMYTRISFSNTWKEFDRGAFKALGFGEFFDMEYFQNYWLNHRQNLTVVDYKAFNMCQKKETAKSIPTVIVKRMRWLKSYSDKEIVEMVLASNVTVPPPVPSLVRFTFQNPNDQVGFIAMYDHLQSGDKGPHHKMLLEVYNSLIPSRQIQKALEVLQSQLPRRYVGVHLRLENDVYNFQEMTKHLPGIVREILDHPCLRRYNLPMHKNERSMIMTTAEQGHNNNGSTNFIPGRYHGPDLYLGSGIFNGKWSIGETNETLQDSSLRSSAVIEAFRKAGYEGKLWYKANVWGAANLGNMNPQDLVLFPEQQALVDLFALRDATCFIPAHRDSSMSYMVDRFRQFDVGDVFGMTPYTTKYDMREWGWGF